MTQKAKAPLLTADLLQTLAHLPPDLPAPAIALLQVGYAGAFRRSEIAALELGDVAWVDEGGAHPEAIQERLGRAGGLDSAGVHPQPCLVGAFGELD